MTRKLIKKAASGTLFDKTDIFNNNTKTCISKATICRSMICISRTKNDKSRTKCVLAEEQ